MSMTQTYSRRVRGTATILGAVLALTGVGTALASIQDDAGYGSPTRLQAGHGPAGPPAAGVETSEMRAGATYGSPGLLQLGHGPGGPAAKR